MRGGVVTLLHCCHISWVLSLKNLYQVAIAAPVRSDLHCSSGLSQFYMARCLQIGYLLWIRTRSQLYCGSGSIWKSTSALDPLGSKRFRLLRIRSDLHRKIEYQSFDTFSTLSSFYTQHIFCQSFKIALNQCFRSGAGSGFFRRSGSGSRF